MVFVDILTSQLFVLGFMGFALAYVALMGFMLYRKGEKRIDALKSGSIPLLLLGIYAFLTGIFGQFLWPLPGSYNILFYDVYTLAGLLFIGIAWSLRTNSETKYVGFFGLLVGAMTLYYGFVGYGLNLTQAPIALLALYSLFGIAGILGYPVSVMLDRSVSGAKSRGYLWTLLIAAFIAALILGSCVSIFIACEAIPAHLSMAP